VVLEVVLARSLENCLPSLDPEPVCWSPWMRPLALSERQSSQSLE
jgi:hypothetical protein